MTKNEAIQATLSAERERDEARAQLAEATARANTAYEAGSRAMLLHCQQTMYDENPIMAELAARVVVSSEVTASLLSLTHRLHDEWKQGDGISWREAREQLDNIEKVRDANPNPLAAAVVRVVGAAMVASNPFKLATEVDAEEVIKSADALRALAPWWPT